MKISLAFIMLTLCCAATAAGDPPVSLPLHDRCVGILRDAVTNGQEWVKVHAAESLLWTGHPENVRELFLKELDGAGPRYRIGVWRVLAQAAPDEKQRQEYVNKIRDVFLDTQAPDRTHAVETLGKLGFTSHDPEFVRVAKEETGSFQAMTRWVLANSGKEEDEALLVETLQSDNADARGCAAYALRFFKTIRPETYAKLKAAALKEPKDSPQRTNILSPWYRHAPQSERPAIRALLLEQANKGTKDDKREMCAALGRVPDPSDIPVLTKLLDDPDLDARAGAAETILRIEMGTR